MEFIFDDETIFSLIKLSINHGKKEVTESMKIYGWGAEKRQECRKTMAIKKRDSDFMRVQKQIYQDKMLNIY